MPIEKKGDQSVAVCDKCKVWWVIGSTPRPVDFRMQKAGTEVVVLCVPCAPEPLEPIAS